MILFLLHLDFVLQNAEIDFNQKNCKKSFSNDFFSSKTRKVDSIRLQTIFQFFAFFLVQMQIDKKNECLSWLKN